MIARGGRVAAALLLASCSAAERGQGLYIQRFFGECTSDYGTATNVAKAEGECGIMTALINRFNAENRDIVVDTNVVAWPGYAQLTAQIDDGKFREWEMPVNSDSNFWTYLTESGTLADGGHECGRLLLQEQHARPGRCRRWRSRCNSGRPRRVDE